MVMRDLVKHNLTLSKHRRFVLSRDTGLNRPPLSGGGPSVDCLKDPGKQGSGGKEEVLCQPKWGDAALRWMERDQAHV